MKHRASWASCGYTVVERDINPDFSVLEFGHFGCCCCSIGGGEPVGLNASVWRIVNPVVFRVSISC